MSKRTLTAAVALGLALISTTRLPVRAQADPGWIGQRVVPRNRTFTLVVDGEEVEKGGKGFTSYRVEQVDGPSLLLRPEGQGASGWAAALGMIRVDQAVDFFTQQIRARPGDAFCRAAAPFSLV